MAANSSIATCTSWSRLISSINISIRVPATRDIVTAPGRFRPSSPPAPTAVASCSLSQREYHAEELKSSTMEMEGIELAMLFPTVGLSFLAHDNMDPQLYPRRLREGRYSCQAARQSARGASVEVRRPPDETGNIPCGGRCSPPRTAVRAIGRSPTMAAKLPSNRAPTTDDGHHRRPRRKWTLAIARRLQ